MSPLYCESSSVWTKDVYDLACLPLIHSTCSVAQQNTVSKPRMLVPRWVSLVLPQKYSAKTVQKDLMRNLLFMLILGLKTVFKRRKLRTKTPGMVQFLKKQYKLLVRLDTGCYLIITIEVFCKRWRLISVQVMGCCVY